MSVKVPITLANGTRIGPVTIICVTVLFLAMFAGFCVLAIYGDPDSTLKLIGPALPVLATIGSALLIYVKAHTVQQTAEQQGKAAADTAADAKAAVEGVSAQVTDTQKKLNGELDQRIASAITTALAQHDVAVTAATVAPEATTPPVKAAAKRRAKKTAKKAS